MKNYITLTAAAMAALTLGACSDDDVVDFRPAAEIEGLVEAEDFDLDVNGYPVPSRAVFLLSDTQHPLRHLRDDPRYGPLQQGEDTHDRLS